MKKREKKLVLAKETVKSLEEATLTKVAGGSADGSCNGSGSCRFCNPSGDIC